MVESIWWHLGKSSSIANAEMGFLLRNAYALTLAWVFIDQLGAPLPAAPVLVAAGAHWEAAGDSGCDHWRVGFVIGARRLVRSGKAGWSRNSQIFVPALPRARFLRSPHRGPFRPSRHEDASGLQFHSGFGAGRTTTRGDGRCIAFALSRTQCRRIAALVGNLHGGGLRCRDRT